MGGGGTVGGPTMPHVLISANKGVARLVSLSFVSKRPWRSEVSAFTRLLSQGWQKGLVGNLSSQAEEWRQHRVSRSVFTFCLFAEWRHGHLCFSPSSLHLPTTLSCIFQKLLQLMTAYSGMVKRSHLGGWSLTKNLRFPQAQSIT